MDNEMLKAIREMLKEELEPIRKEFKEELESIKVAQKENGQILRALDERTQVFSADFENTKHEVSEIMGSIESLRKDLANVEIITSSNWNEIAKLKKIK